MRKRLGALLARVGESIRRTWQRIIGRDEPEDRPGLPPAGRPAPKREASPRPEEARTSPDGGAGARRKIEQQARREVAEQLARGKAEARARREAEERGRPEAEKQARREAEERARREAAAHREAEERARREAEERARREAEERARREAEERARREAEERARREAEERARREAEEQARREAEDQARREAEERARREAEERARREAEERARREAEERARREAEELARREAEELARREAEELARREAEEQAAREAEEQAAREAEELARREAEEQAAREAEEQAAREAEEQAAREAEEQAAREAEEQADREAEEEAALLEADAQARLEAAQAESLDFEARMAEAEMLEGVELAAQERLDELVDAARAAGAAPSGSEPSAAEAQPPEAQPPRPRPSVEVPSDYVPSAESEHALYQVETEAFAGPLDLLLFLIRRHALDIFDIPMAFVCERYVEYLKAMERLEIDVAAEFLAMAAELLHIKSKMLLPRPAEVEEEEEIDPRAELVRRLLEYQKYKDAAERLESLNRNGRDTFGRNPEELPAPAEKAPLAEVSLFALIEAFDAVLKRQKPELRHRVMMEAVSVRQRIRALVDVFAERHRVPFVELLGDMAERIDIVVSFLAVLEMARLRLLRVYQSTEGEIYLEARFATAQEAHARLEGIDTTLDGEPATGGEGA